MLDYIIVGFGLSGLHFSHVLNENNKTFKVFDNNSQCASKVAGGLYNPVILKRFTMAWNGAEQLKEAIPVYQDIEQHINTTIDQKIPVCRKFDSIEEQNNWFTAADKPILSNFLDTNIITNTNDAIHANRGLGTVKHTGRIKVEELLDSYSILLGDNYHAASFQYDALSFQLDHVVYKGIKAKRIVFCEGYGLKNNPFFSYLPLNGTKGELLIIRAPKLQLDYVYKASVFIIPLGDHLYTVGATYNWTDKSNDPTAAAREELLEKLNKCILCDYEVIDQTAGIRPTVIDRRPLLGVHPKYSQIAVLNGMGTRGVMLAPTHARKLYNYLEHKIPLEKSVDINRFQAN